MLVRFLYTLELQHCEHFNSGSVVLRLMRWAYMQLFLNPQGWHPVLKRVGV